MYLGTVNFKHNHVSAKGTYYWADGNLWDYWSTSRGINPVILIALKS